MKKIKENLIPLCCLISLPLVNLIYCSLNRTNSSAHSLITDLDQSIPFQKIFVVPYIGWFGFLLICLVYFCLKDKDIYYRTLTTIIVSMLICYIIYYFYQTTVPRPILKGTDILTRLVGWVYQTDNPYNCFPSIHSLTSFILIRAIIESKAGNKLSISLISSIAVTIIFSTFFIKQHVILDAVSAIFLGNLVFNIVLRFNCKGIFNRIKYFAGLEKKFAANRN